MAITSAAGAYAATQSLLSSGAGAKPAIPSLAGPGGGGQGGFGALLEQAMDGFSQSGRKAETSVLSATGGKADLVDVVTAVAESETALQTLVAVRDRMITAYEDVLRMQI